MSVGVESVFALTTNNTTKVNFPINEINNASLRVKNLTETYYMVPNYVEIKQSQNNYQVTLPQFLQLLTEDILKINSGLNTPVTVKNNLSYPTNPVQSFTKGVIYKTEYLNIAQTLKTFISSNNRMPNYITTSLGKMRYETVVYMFSKITSFYQTNGRLPSSVSMAPSGTIRPVYIVSDNIKNNKVDTERCNNITAALKKLGIPAYFYGLGPSYHYTVLENSSIPQNALIVEIAGGTCAATIAEKAGTWYKKLKGNRKVTILLIDTAKQITGLEWLPRAGDDNFSPPSFTGVARPDLILLNNGYNYIEGIKGSDIASMVYFIMKEALT